MDFYQASLQKIAPMKSGFIQQKVFMMLKIKLNMDVFIYHLKWPTKMYSIIYFKIFRFTKLVHIDIVCKIYFAN